MKLGNQLRKDIAKHNESRFILFLLNDNLVKHKIINNYDFKKIISGNIMMFEIHLFRDFKGATRQREIVKGKLLGE